MTFIAAVPYEKQSNEWSCGAASLTMVYRSFGIECSQSQIWEAVAGRNARGGLCARAQSLAAHAIHRGLHAVAIQARDPWRVLDLCVQQSVSVIVNHVPDPKSGRGHYSVLIAISDDRVVLHDPVFGPNRTVTRNEFLKMWNPRSKFTEILDQVLIAISASPSHLELCPLCEGQAADSVTCESCRRVVRLQPLAILGCLTDWCPMRAWEQVFCPWCDHSWTKGLATSKRADG